MKAPGFGERKSSYLEDIAILTGAQVVKDELGLSLDKVSLPFLRYTFMHFQGWMLCSSRVCFIAAHRSWNSIIEAASGHC